MHTFERRERRRAPEHASKRLGKQGKGGKHRSEAGRGGFNNIWATKKGKRRAKDETRDCIKNHSA